jgi:hypothetical protein
VWLVFLRFSPFSDAERRLVKLDLECSSEPGGEGEEDDGFAVDRYNAAAVAALFVSGKFHAPFMPQRNPACALLP